MAIQTHVLQDDRVILEDITCGSVFGIIFDANPDAVDTFLLWLQYRGSEDPRDMDVEDLQGEWKSFLEDYRCNVCMEGDLALGELSLCESCGLLFCPSHEGPLEDDREHEFGHEC